MAVCLECGQELRKMSPTHVKRCSGITMAEYYQRHPDAWTAKLENHRRWVQANPERQRAAEQRSRKNNPERARANGRAQWVRKPMHEKQANRRRQTLKLYGLTVQQYDAMIAEQDGRCRICGRVPQGEGQLGRLQVDHDHTTGAVRGLLCSVCNVGLGTFGDDIERLRAAVAYLEQFQVDPFKD